MRQDIEIYLLRKEAEFLEMGAISNLYKSYRYDADKLQEVREYIQELEFALTSFAKRLGDSPYDPGGAKIWREMREYCESLNLEIPRD
jgi:hypothetical protein